MLDQFVEVAQSEQLKAHFALGDFDFKIQRYQPELECTAVRLVGEILRDLVNVFDRVDFFVDIDRAGKFDDQGLAVVREAGVKTLVSGDLGIVQRDDLGGELVIFRIFRALVDPHLQVEVGRLDAAEAIFAGVVEFAPLVAKQAAYVGIELIDQFFDILMADFAYKCLCRRVVAVGQVMALLIAFEAAHASLNHADDAALEGGGVTIWSVGVDGEKEEGE